LALRWLVRANTYHDSIKLMRISEALGALDGVVRAAAVMGTPLNRELLADDGLLPPGVDVSSDDLLVTVLSEHDDAADHALARLDELLQVRNTSDDGTHSSRPHTLASGLPVSGSNLAVIAVPGVHAAAEAFAALRAGLHVFLFSDNVSVHDEVRLKRLAAERDLLMMGPDCGTAILGGVGLGFANRIESGPVGIVGASGTGIQQVCCLLDEAGIGVAAAIGTGGRDLNSAVGGSMTRRAVAALKSDDAVQIVVVISKPADGRVAQRLHKDLVKLRKPSVVCLLGADMEDEGPVRYAANLTETAHMVIELLGGEYSALDELPRVAAPGRPDAQVYGLFAGGTLRTEAAQVLEGMGVAHTLLDLGADEYTRGRAHPMIDPRLRAGMVADLAGKEDVGAVLFDVILGDLAHDDPAGAVIPALKELQATVAGPPPPIYVALIGTRRDPQGLTDQRARLEATGAHVFAGNVAAATAAGRSIGSAT
jgi:FdrA protein